MKFNWKNLPKPFFVLAPMEGATDTVFRQIITDCAPPDVFFTEFTNTDGILSKGAEHVGQRLVFTKKEKPLIAQVWGVNPDSFYKASKIISKMGFDGIDINMGCPEKSIVKRGSCAGLIRNPELASQIIQATKKGAGKLPVSVKTRIGFTNIEITWIEFLLNQNLDALTLHLRTRKEMSKVPAHLELLEDLVRLKNKISPETVLIANGDIPNRLEGELLAKKYNVEGIMIGRGVFHDPYAFSKDESLHYLNKKEKIKLLMKHLDLFEKTWKGKKSYHPLKRYFKIYINEFEDASELRESLMETKNIEEARQVLAEIA